MTMLSREDLDSQIHQLARAEAERVGADEWERRRLESDASEIIRDAFYALSWERIATPVSAWFHRRPENFAEDWRSLLIMRNDLRDAAERYLERPWLWHRNLDWFFVDALTYAEFQGYFDVLKKKNMTMFGYVFEKSAKEGTTHWLTVARSALFLMKWAIWAALMFVAAQIGPVAVGTLVCVTVAWKWLIWTAGSNERRLLAQMVKAYSALGTISQSWAVVWDELNRARNAGVVWDGVVYRLVETRMNEAPRMDKRADT